ncbi:MAG TPA: adenylate/guanylate cyclase domain-containing protein [Chitinophagaceae bacterium]|nr:adenylate/guanylate cyclase domain-containing protein [Chitinophagaceae bacterium]
MQSISRFINFFVPEQTVYNEWEYRKTRLLVTVCFVNALYSLFFLPTSIMEEYWGAVWVIIPNIICNAALPLLIKNRVSLVVVANAYIIVLGVSLSAIMAISGGVYHTATDPQLMVLMPVMALLFLNFRWALFWFFVAIAIVSTFGILELNGYDFDIKMNYKYIQLQNLLAVVGHIVLLSMVINVFENQKNEALARLEENRRIVEEEKKKSDELLLNILPEAVMNELKHTGRTTACNYDLATVMFVDFKDFTLISNNLTPEELVDGIGHYFETFDTIVTAHDIEKIKTVGDAYLCAAGLPVPNTKNPVEMVDVAFKFLHAVAELKQKRDTENKITFDIRIGIHSGPLIAGVVGTKKFAYDIWGDAVNTAARMQQNGEEGKINISGTTYELVKHRFHCTHRGRIDAKNKGLVDMYFVDGRR